MSRADYAHWNEDADYIWWQEEGRHQEEPPDDNERYFQEDCDDDLLCVGCGEEKEEDRLDEEYCEECQRSLDDNEEDYEPSVCPNCGKDEHTLDEPAVCYESILGPPRSER